MRVAAVAIVAVLSVGTERHREGDLRDNRLKATAPKKPSS